MVIGAKSQRQDTSKRLLTRVLNKDVASPTTGDLWYNTSANKLKFCYNDSGSTITIVNADGEVIPSGMISMWSGSASNVPDGWVLCDGTNNTPNLSDKFIYGTTTDGEYGNTGGNSTISHSHTVNSHNHSISSVGSYEYMTSDGSGVASSTHDHGGNTGNTSPGTDTDTSDNIPPYFQMAFIMKT